MKNSKILEGKLHIKLARVANQIITIVAYLSNFQPALVPPPTTSSETHVNLSPMPHTSSASNEAAISQPAEHFTLAGPSPISGITCLDSSMNIDLHSSDEDSELVHSSSSNNSFIIDL